MNRVTRLLLAVFALGTLLLGSTAANAGTAPWSRPTAYTLPQGRLEVSVFAPARYGLRDRVEIGVHPLFALVDPAVYAKLGVRQIGLWDLASRHHLAYPTPLLRLVARKGTGGLLPSDARIPGILSLSNELVATRMSDAGHLLNLSVGVRNALLLGRSDIPTLDLPILYPRTLPFQGRTVVTLGGSYHLRPPTSFQLRLGGELFAVPGDKSWSLEHDLTVLWMISSHVSLSAGYKFIVGRYPFGTEANWVPIFDVTWASF